MKAATFALALEKADVLRLSTEIRTVFTSHKRQAPQATMNDTVDSTLDTTVDGTDCGQRCGQLRSYVAT